MPVTSPQHRTSSRVLRARLPDHPPRRPARRRPSGRRPGRRAGPQPRPDARRAWVSRPDRLRMMRSFDPRSARLPLDVEDPTTAVPRTSRRSSPSSSALAARPATTGSTNRLAGESLLMKRFGVPAPAAVLAGAVRRRGRPSPDLCFTVLAPWQLGKNTTTSRENTQIANSLTTDPVPRDNDYLPQQDSSAHDDQWQRVTAPRATTCPRPRCWPGCGSVEGAPALRGRWCRSPSTAGRRCWSTAATSQPEQGTAGATHRAARRPSRSPSPRGCGTRSAGRGQEPIRQDGAAAGVLDQHRPDLPR